ncbi:FAD-dependent oxidoreductase [Nonomuraea sp. K274]|uniref:FAD-dependent oxidoreductase n=1 Tax=Nonomuraea cypriaca TaxID=1187855 RepID=A0A931AFD3_9ACTN|nr:FAD-dependent oxidoreductase [Nonomuraea cypriaca]MBF8191922.1 FAD-dependent oxidoreductase [Nonomuraea cypriaca]
MKPRIVILGGGIAGLAAAIGLVRRGYPVALIERDPPPPADEDLDPFLAWKRRGVPQFRLPHGFSARARTLLAEHAPEVLDRLRADGIEEVNVFKTFTPAEFVRPSDDEFTVVWARRSAFELALRRCAEAEPGITFLCPELAGGLSFAQGEPRVTGVRLADGREIATDLVLDCGGGRSRTSRWLAAAGVHVPADTQDCETVYFSRYYRFTPGCALPRNAMLLRGELESLMYIGFPGDHDTFGLCFEVHPSEEDLRPLRNTWAWEAAARSIPDLAPWIDPANATPLDGIQIMGGHHNARRYFVVDGRPVVTGLLPVGDALCTTNPAYGWGASMALTYAFAAAEAVAAHENDPVAMALAYDAATATEADAVYRESAAMDRARIYRITGQEVPEHDRAEMERQRLIAEGVAAGVLSDVELSRAFCRRINLTGPADAVINNPDLVLRAKDNLRERAARPPVESGPDIQRLREIVLTAEPTLESSPA